MDDNLEAWEKLARAVLSKARLDTVYFAIGEPQRIYPVSASSRSAWYPAIEFQRFGTWDDGLLRNELDSFWHSVWAESLCALLSIERRPQEEWRRIIALARSKHGRRHILRVLSGEWKLTPEDSMDDWGESVAVGRIRTYDRKWYYAQGKRCEVCGVLVTNKARSCWQHRRRVYNLTNKAREVQQCIPVVH